MSTLDPGLEPPGDWQSPYPPTPRGPGGPTNASNTAAVYVWICAGMGLMMTCCCVLNAAVMPLQPQLFMEQLPPDLPPELQNVDWNQFIVVLSTVLVILYLVVLLIPSIVLMILGFGVRKGARGQMTAAKVLIWLFAALGGLGLVLSLINLAVTSQIITLVLPALVFGGWLWLSLTAIAKLKIASQSSPDMKRADPWGA